MVLLLQQKKNTLFEKGIKGKKIFFFFSGLDTYTQKKMSHLRQQPKSRPKIVVRRPLALSTSTSQSWTQTTPQMQVEHWDRKSKPKTKEPIRVHDYHHADNDIFAKILTGSLPTGWPGTAQFVFKMFELFESNLKGCVLPLETRRRFRHFLVMSDMFYIHYVLFMLLAMEGQARETLIEHIPPENWKIFKGELSRQIDILFRESDQSPSTFNLFSWIQHLRHFYLSLF